jgi:hypothetical protein
MISHIDDIEKIKKQIEDWRAERVARGLPAEPPKDFVPSEVGYLLMERHKHLFEFFVKYAKLCNEANEKLPIDVSTFEKYDSDLRLIDLTIGGEVLSAFSNGIGFAISLAKEPGRHSTTDYIGSLYSSLQLAKIGMETRLDAVSYNYKLDSIENRELYQKAKAAYERYKGDEVLFNTELDRLRAHYEFIKHLF